MPRAAGLGLEGPILGCLFRSTILAYSAPNDMVLLVAFLGGAKHDLTQSPDARVIEIAKAELWKYLGTSGQPSRVFFERWRNEIPRVVRDYAEKVRRIVEWSRASPVSVVCSGVRGVALPLCVATGRTDAERLAAGLRWAVARPQELLECR